MSSLLSRAVRSGASSAVASSSKLSSRPISHRTFHAGPPAADPTLRLVFGSLKLSWTIPVRSILLSLGLESTQSGSTPQLALAGQNMPTAFPEQAQDNDDPLSWDGILNAVPKHRTTHSRKRMRSANKGLKDRVDLVHCPGCGTPKLYHHICPSCYSDIARRQKVAIAQEKENELLLAEEEKAESAQKSARAAGKKAKPTTKKELKPWQKVTDAAQRKAGWTLRKPGHKKKQKTSKPPQAAKPKRTAKPVQAKATPPPQTAAPAPKVNPTTTSQPSAAP